MSGVQLRGLTKAYQGKTVLDDFSADIAEGEFVTLLGASGSGKTTCLRIVAGFVSPDAGQVLLDGEDVTRLDPSRREAGMVFQHYALFPHLTVAENVAFGLQVRRVPSAEIRRRVGDALDLVDLSQLAGRYPAQLSGGQKQRVALARAIVIRPRVLLLDEPLSALDLKLREQLQGEIKAIQQALRITTIFVTHDQNEALTMSDRVVVMRDGLIEQIASPAQLYRLPSSLYVASFIGRMNFIDARLRSQAAGRCLVSPDAEQGVELAVARGAVPALEPGAPVRVAVRPEHVGTGSELPNRLRIVIEKLTYVGEGWIVSGVTAHGDVISYRAASNATMPAPGTHVEIGWQAENALLFAAKNDVAGTAAAGRVS